ncbi:MAG: hypothetical protein ACK4TA_18315 [Saprospiraceae bacterium]
MLTNSPGYDNNGSFIVTVTDGSGCAGTYRVEAQPIAGSGPSGSTPPLTFTTTYIGFPAGGFSFTGASPGQYQVTVTEEGAACDPPKNPITFVVTVPDGASGGACDTPNPQQFTTAVNTINAPTCAYDSPGYDNNGSFIVNVTDGSGCAGTYRVDAQPIAGSGPSGSTPSLTSTTTYIGFPAGGFSFTNAGPGQYQVTVTEEGAVCDPPKNPITFVVTVPDGASGGACDTPNPQQFTVATSNITAPTCAYDSPGYDNNGSFIVNVTDGSGCAGTYRVDAQPIAGSGPSGSTPSLTSTTTYIGFPAGGFSFTNAGPGQYQVTVTEEGAVCDPPKNPITFVVTVPDGASGGACDTPNPQQFTVATSNITAPTCAYDSPGYDNNGSFLVTVTDGSGCAGTYRVEAQPIAGSGPSGSTPPITTTATFIGFSEGDFEFERAGPGQYQVTIKQTNPNCSPAKNPITFVVTVPDGYASQLSVSADQTVCSTKIPQALTATIASLPPQTTVTYQWEMSTTDCVRDFVPIANATDLSYTFTSPLTQTTYFRLRVIFMMNGVSCDCDIVSNCITITVSKVNCGAFPWDGKTN